MAEQTLLSKCTTAEAPVPSPVPRDRSHPPTSDLLREALDETRQLVRLEVALAREEWMSEVAAAKRAGVAFAAAASTGIAALTMFLVALALAFAGPWMAALVIGAVALSLAAALALAGWKVLPRKPLVETKERIETDLKQFKERIV